MMQKLVLALGGNALVKRGENVEYQTQIKNLIKTLDPLEFLFKEYNVVLTHGNGPQVGNLINLIEQYGMHYPLHTLVSMTQASIGSMIQEVLRRRYDKWGIKKEIDVVMTRTRVKDDKEVFKNPTKPVGPFITRAQAAVLKYDGKSVVKIGKSYRRVVPSPIPEGIVEAQIIKKLIMTNTVVCCGGGGIPVTEESGRLERVDAVVDKDLASAVLGIQVGTKELVMMTDVDGAYLNFKKKNQKLLENLSAKNAQKYLTQGHFEKGSMAPKIEAAVNFLNSGGRRAIICSSNNLENAINGVGGTVIRK